MVVRPEVIASVDFLLLKVHRVVGPGGFALVVFLWLLQSRMLHHKVDLVFLKRASIASASP